MDYLIQSHGQLSSHLRALRKARGLSQAQLGAALGVGQSRITRIEHEPTAISVEQFLGLLGVLGVQMVLRPAGIGQIAGQPKSTFKATTATRAVVVKGRPPDEPW